MDILEIPPDSISTVMVKTTSGSDIQLVASKIEAAIPYVSAVESNNLFHSQRMELLSLLRSVLALLGVAWLLCILLISLVFSMAVNERRQEIGVMRALGFTRVMVLKSLLSEGLVLGLVGGIFGIALFTFTIFLFRNLIIQMMSVPFLIPSMLNLIALALGTLVLTLGSVTIGAIIPTLRASLMDPSIAMRK
jgi:putative ABC transport system permease protein